MIIKDEAVLPLVYGIVLGLFNLFVLSQTPINRIPVLHHTGWQVLLPIGWVGIVLSVVLILVGLWLSFKD